MLNNEILDTPWGIHVDIVMRRRGYSQARAVEAVTIEWLCRGNVKPLAYWFEEGVAPSSNTLRCFALMLVSNTALGELFPFKLCLHKRVGGRGRPFGATWQPTLIDYLNRGDMRLLMGQLERGIAPESFVLRHLAKMLVPSDGTEVEVPYEFQVRHRSPGQKGRPEDILVEIRDKFIAQNFANRLARFGRGSYQSVAIEIADETGLSEQTARDAYDKHFATAAKSD